MPREAPVRAYVGLGSNLSVPLQQMASALDALAALADTHVVRASSFYRTAPVGYAGQPDFVNAVVAIDTGLAPRALLDALLAIERERGRVRTVPNGPRTLDLDLLAYGDVQLNEPSLTLPHPRMHERAFVIVPLAEIAPDFDVAGHGTAGRLARTLAAEQRVERIAID